MTNNIIIAKGSYSVTVQTVEVDDNYSNKIIDKIPTTRAPQEQELGPVNKILVDLLDVTHEILVRGEITATATKTAEEIRNDLIAILKGAGVSSGSGKDMHCTVTYGESSFNMYISKLAIKEKASDYTPASDTVEKANYQGISKYTVQITLIEGVSVIT